MNLKIMKRIRTIWVKIKRFISKGINNIKYVKSLKTLHQRLVSTDVDTLHDKRLVRNPYQMFFDWLFFEIVTYGCLIAVPFFIFFGFEKWYSIFAFGILRWLFFDTIRNVRKSIIGVT